MLEITIYTIINTVSENKIHSKFKINHKKDQMKIRHSLYIPLILFHTVSTAMESISPKLAKRCDADISVPWAFLDAAAQGNVDKIKDMLAHNQDLIDCQETLYGNTALHVAALAGHVETVRTLIEHRANVRAINKVDNTALHLAAKHGSPEIITLLLAAKAAVNARNFYRKATPLHVAIIYNRNEAAQCLIEGNADLNITNLLGESPLDYALEENNEQIVKLLRERGAKAYQQKLPAPSPAVSSANPQTADISNANLAETTKLDTSEAQEELRLAFSVMVFHPLHAVKQMHEQGDFNAHSK